MYIPYPMSITEIEELFNTDQFYDASNREETINFFNSYHMIPENIRPTKVGEYVHSQFDNTNYCEILLKNPKHPQQIFFDFYCLINNLIGFNGKSFNSAKYNYYLREAYGRESYTDYEISNEDAIRTGMYFIKNEDLLWVHIVKGHSHRHYTYNTSIIVGNIKIPIFPKQILMHKFFNKLIKS